MSHVHLINPEVPDPSAPAIASLAPEGCGRGPERLHLAEALISSVILNFRHALLDAAEP